MWLSCCWMVEPAGPIMCACARLMTRARMATPSPRHPQTPRLKPPRRSRPNLAANRTGQLESRERERCTTRIGSPLASCSGARRCRMPCAGRDPAEVTISAGQQNFSLRDHSRELCSCRIASARTRCRRSRPSTNRCPIARSTDHDRPPADHKAKEVHAFAARCSRWIALTGRSAAQALASRGSYARCAGPNQDSTEGNKYGLPAEQLPEFLDALRASTPCAAWPDDPGRTFR